MDVVYQGARNPSACKKRHKILCAKGARNPAQAGKKIASPKAINYIKHCSSSSSSSSTSSSRSSRGSSGGSSSKRNGTGK